MDSVGKCDNVIRGNGGGIRDDDGNNFWASAFHAFMLATFLEKSWSVGKTTLERILVG